MATVFVTHDLAEASILCDRCAILDAGHHSPR
jgi:ABC-type proline/glycine betaine transport system ATPase subunit